MAVVGQQQQQQEEQKPVQTEWMKSILQGPAQLSLGAQVLEDLAFYLRDILQRFDVFIDI